MTQERFDGSFTQQEPIPEAGIAAALAVLRHGRLHRYNIAPGEVAETALLEEEFAALIGRALLSGGRLGRLCAWLCAAGLAGAGGRAGADQCLYPRPGARRDCGGRGVPVFVEVTEDLMLDLADLAAKAKAIGRAGADAEPYARASVRHGGADGAVRAAGRARSSRIAPIRWGRPGRACPRGGRA